MTPCLRPDGFIDVLDGVADRATTAHLDACPRCQTTLADVRAALASVETAAVPEPSPLFWPQVNARVRAAMAADEAGREGMWSWLRWDVVLPLAGLAVVVAALVSAVGRPPTTAPSRAEMAARTAASTAEPHAALDAALDADADADADAAVDADAALELMLDLAATVPGSEWDTLGVTTLPDLGEAARSLADDEQRALSALLQAAVERPSL